jgi:hypothetical protein
VHALTTLSPQGLKPNSWLGFISELKLRPPREKTTSGPPQKDGPYITKRSPRTDLKVGHYKSRTGTTCRAPTKRNSDLGEKDLGFGFDDEEGVGIGMALGAELLESVVKGGSQD